MESKRQHSPPTTKQRTERDPFLINKKEYIAAAVSFLFQWHHLLARYQHLTAEEKQHIPSPVREDLFNAALIEARTAVEEEKHVAFGLPTKHLSPPGQAHYPPTPHERREAMTFLLHELVVLGTIAARKWDTTNASHRFRAFVETLHATLKAAYLWLSAANQLIRLDLPHVGKLLSEARTVEVEDRRAGPDSVERRWEVSLPVCPQEWTQPEKLWELKEAMDTLAATLHRSSKKS